MALTFGVELKKWRIKRRFSQLELSAEADVSQRHISFLESGKSKPSREMVLHLAQILDVPKFERNHLLSAAGFSSSYSANELSSSAMKPIRSALSWTLQRHDPYPAFVLDRHWNILEANTSAQKMIELMGLPSDLSMIDLLLGDHGLRECITNWNVVSGYLLARLKTENSYLGGDPVFEKAIQKLHSVQTNLVHAAGDELVNPLVVVDLAIGQLQLSMLSSIAQFGAANDFALADLKVELYFPADDRTREFFEGLV